MRKVRIAVVMDSKGEWYAEGWGFSAEPNADDADMEKAVLRRINTYDSITDVRFVEVDFPVPQFQRKETLQGELIQKE